MKWEAKMKKKGQFHPEKEKKKKNRYLLLVSGGFVSFFYKAS